MEQLTIACDIVATDPTARLGVEIWLDNDKLLDTVPGADPVQFNWSVDEDQQDHVLKFVLKNKLPEHTRIDSGNQIIQDAWVEFRHLKFSGFDLGKIVADQAVYTHDFNGTGASTQDRFYGVMGCNGTVELKFTTPVYLWLLEHM